MNLVEVVRKALLSVKATTDAEAMTILAGVAGRGQDQYGARLRTWLESNPEAFPEQIDVGVVDHLRDAGVDVILTGQTSGARVGFQIKSDNDLAHKEFTRELKAQITDARTWGLSLYVIVLACRPTKENQQKYLHTVNEIGRSPDNYILVIPPNRAAALLRAFDSPLTLPPDERQSWPDFFTAANQPDLVFQYVDDWEGLTPDARFQPPAEFDDLLKSVSTNPLTILTGPPAVGKTFSALQVLWREFQNNREVEWITPKRFSATEGVIDEPEPPPDMLQRIELLTRQLGLTPRQPPLDTTEFIAAHLKPSRTIYIEDPFGKTEYEFNISMHTYRFFDLNKFVSEISEGAARYGCHVLITSREALFERWLSEVRQRGETPPRFTLVQISKHSYEYRQRLAIARTLASARGVQNIEEAARIIAGHVDVPFDAEVIARDLPAGATINQVSASARKPRVINADKVRSRFVSDNDGERLFLLLLIALSESDRVKENNFYEAFTRLHAALAIEGDAEDTLVKATQKYRSIISRREIFLLEGSPSGRGVSMVTKSDEKHYNLEPVHSTVVDAISSHLLATAKEWLNVVAASLRTPVQGYTARLAQTKIAHLFIRWQVGTTEEVTQDGVFEAIFSESGRHFFNVPAIMSSWAKLPLRFRERFFKQLEEESSFIHTSDACSLISILNIPPDDAWRLLRILLDKPALGVSLIPGVYGHPWKYMADHLDEIPPALKEALDRKADKEPELFTYALSGVLVDRWDELPEGWRATFLEPRVLSDEHARDNLFAYIARNWNDSTDELKRLFLDRSRHEDYHVRAAVAVSALVYHESAPEDFEPIYMAAVQDENPHVPLLVMRGGMGDDDHDRRFAEALYEKAGEAAAACMLSLLTDRGEPKVEWKAHLADSCAAKGGDFSSGVLAYHCLDKRVGEFMGYRLADSPEGEPEPVRLAWLWAYINSKGRQPPLSDDSVINLVNGLSSQYRYLVLYYLSVQANHLPRPLDFYVERIGLTSDADHEAITEGLDNRQPLEGSRSSYGYPVSQFVSS
jgi:hypothetical protein